VQHDGGAKRCLVACRFSSEGGRSFPACLPFNFFSLDGSESGAPSVRQRGLRSICQCMAFMSRRRERRISASYSLVALLGETSSSQTMTSLVSISM
jgi:hypothetical protein